VPASLLLLLLLLVLTDERTDEGNRRVQRGCHLGIDAVSQ
jgi:hypothetical protein